MKKRILGSILILVLVFAAAAQAVFADQGSVLGTGKKAVRTIMLYDCGSNLESQSGMASFNLRQVLKAKFSATEDIRFIVMTGGAEKWQLESSYLSINKDLLPDGEPDNKISGRYNQIWEAKGADAPDQQSKMVLLDGDGITAETPVKSDDELMSDKETLRAFINYCVRNYPAEKFDLILWDHGGGPLGGFGMDDHDKGLHPELMPFNDIVDALAHNELTDPADKENKGKFDFINFDACLMNSVELDLVLADYTDYYIASPELEPGYGQDYTGWLNVLGNDPYTGTFELGKQVVDDFIDFYMNMENEGYGQEGTLAVFDLKGMVDGGMADALDSVGTILREQAGDGLFYDELLSVRESIQYGMENYFDFGNLASLLSVTSSERSKEQIEDGVYTDKNAYSEAGVAAKVGSIMNNDDLVYAKGTKGIISKDQVYRHRNGELEHGDLTTSGTYIYFATPSYSEEVVEYYNKMTKVLEDMPIKDDGRYEALKKYRDVMIDYALICKTGETVDEMIQQGKATKADINYDTMKKFWKDCDVNYWDESVSWSLAVRPIIEKRGGETEETIAWLDKIIKQQAEEAVEYKNISAAKVKQKDGTGYRVYITDTRKRTIQSVNRIITAEIPAMYDYVQKNYPDKDEQDMILQTVNISMGEESGYLTDEDLLEKTTVEDLINFYNSRESTWTLPAIEEKLYAIKDAEGRLHAAAIREETDSKYYIEVVDGFGKKGSSPLLLGFDKDPDGNHRLSELLYKNDTGYRAVRPGDLTVSLSLMPVLYEDYFEIREYRLPTSDSEFELTGENAKKISLVYTDVREISDVSDVDGDGEPFHNVFALKGIYNSDIDITEIVNNAEKKLIDIKFAWLKPAPYTGDVVKPVLMYRGNVLEEGKDYSWKFLFDSDEEPEPELRETGGYRLLIKGLGDFTAYAAETFYIIKDELAAETLLEQAQEELEAANTELSEATKSGDQGRLDAAYNRLVKAQNALAAAIAELELTMKALTEEQQALLEEQIDILKDNVEELTDKLDDAMVVDISPYRASVKKKCVYTGKKLTPKVTVAGLASSKYQASYKNNRKVGTALIEITGKGRYYKGQIKLKFDIVPKKASVKKAAAGKGKITVKAGAKVSKTGGAKYEIRYKAKGTSKWKKKTTSKQSVTINGLNAGKKYQVKIRAFSKKGSKKYYGAWSKVKVSGSVK